MNKSKEQTTIESLLPEKLKEFLNSWDESDRVYFKTEKHKEWQLTKLNELVTKKCANYPYYQALIKYKEDGANIPDSFDLTKTVAIGDDNGDFLILYLKDLSLWTYWVSSDEFEKCSNNYEVLIKQAEKRNFNVQLGKNSTKELFLGEWHPQEDGDSLKLFDDGSFIKNYSVGDGTFFLIRDKWGVKENKLVFKNNGSQDHIYSIKSVDQDKLLLTGPEPLTDEVTFIKKETETFQNLESKTVYDR